MSKMLIEDYEQLKKENKELKQKLKKTSSYVDRFNILVENSYEWVWEVDANGIYTYASPQVKAVLGYEPEELIGKTPFDFMNEDEAVRVGKIFSDIASKEESFSKLVNICVRKNGTEAHTETSGQPFYDEFGMFIGYRGIDFDRTQDINEYRNVEKALKEHKEAFETIFEYSSDGTLLIEDGKFIACNQAIVKIMKASSKEDFLNMHPSELSPEFQPDGRRSYEKAEEMMDICLKKGHNHFEWVHRRKDGENFWAEILLTRLNIKNKPVIHVSWRDISDRKALENDLEASNIRYKELISELDLQVKEQSAQLIKKSRMAQIGELLSMIAHQWRQPLSSIGSVAINVKIRLSLLDAKESNSEEIKDLHNFINDKMNSIESFVSSLSNTIDDFRTLYKPDKIMHKNSIMKPINNAKTLVEGSFIDSAIKLNESINSDISIYMHQNEIMQVILNLLKNAEENFLVNDTKNPTIFIETLIENDDAVINISDNGGGISKEIQDEIFNPYFSTKDEKNGTGLGLYMCKIIIEDHHKGKLSISNTDKGACFTIRLPIQ